MKSKTIAIIGGEGMMGRAFAVFFQKAGWVVVCADQHTKVRPATAAAEANVILFAVPIATTPRVIAEVAPYAKAGSLLVDITSLKIPVAAALKRWAPRDAELLSIHPLFGPHNIADMKSQVIAVCPLRPGPLSKNFLMLFQKAGAILKVTTPRRHDAMMAVIQGMTHLSAIASAVALETLGVNILETLAFASPIYRLRLAMIGRILAQSSKLYADIALLNPKTSRTLDAYRNALKKIARVISARDEKKFRTLFEKGACHFGKFKDQAERQTDEIITFMSERAPRTKKKRRFLR